MEKPNISDCCYNEQYREEWQKYVKEHPESHAEMVKALVEAGVHPTKTDYRETSMFRAFSENQRDKYEHIWKEVEFDTFIAYEHLLIDKTRKPEKTSINIRIDDDVLSWFKDEAPKTYHWKYQTMINNALRYYMNLKKCDSSKIKKTVKTVELTDEMIANLTEE